MPEETTPLLDDLVVRSAGYLKIPKAFKDKYPNWDTKPSPIASLSKSGNSVSLVFTWEGTLEQ